MEVECEKCPVACACEAYREARKDNDYSYHPQNVVRTYESECPIVKLIKKAKPK